MKELEVESPKLMNLASKLKLIEEMKVDDGNYSGSVRDGMPHGKGELVDLLGTVFKGTCQNRKREGLHVGKAKFGTVYEKNYKNWKTTVNIKIHIPTAE